ncbi:helix-turn-helix domain-containing protein [Cohnella herbarum]|uniref:Helix-turn-helix transcriptional regulator n=1 Tax=Cohnella herbarum TaxID=2728023 RepID=A0A7Z2VH94_9BACL|nr:AraC family transcriptional regulator [Cohnella herbarum]QJD82890.1 helix-turn-helix transcriptional regulator [Cohnella herbarum]
MSEASIVELQAPPLPYFVEAGRAEFRAGDRHPNRRNLGIYDLLIMAEGELHIGENGKEWSLREGDTLLLLPYGEHYSVKPCERKTVFYWVHFEHVAKQQGVHAEETDTHALLPFGNPYSLRIPKQICLSNPQIAFELMRQLLLLPVGDSFWEEQRLFAGILALLEEGRSSGTSSSATRLAEKAAAYLQLNFRNEITNETLAEELHFHPNYIVRCMKMKYGVTPIHYLLEFRLERAKRLLVSTEWSIERIAEEVGFRYSPYFSSSFKRSVGLSPLKYRKQYVN